nr:hypothetical protein [Verrucomicrobiota bacterium]
MKVNRTGCLAIVCCGLVALASAHAGENLRTVSGTNEARDRFSGGSWELENLVGAYFLFDRGGNQRVTVDYAINSTRLGIM